IVVVSGFVGFEKEAYERGAAAFIAKPFSVDSIKQVVDAALERRQLEPSASEELTRHSRDLRRAAAKAAEASLARLRPQLPDLEDRGVRIARWLPAYIGYGDAVFSLILDGEVRTFAASDEKRFPRHGSLDSALPLARDVLETGSNLILPD